MHLLQEYTTLINISIVFHIMFVLNFYCFILKCYNLLFYMAFTSGVSSSKISKMTRHYQMSESSDDEINVYANLILITKTIWST